MRTYVLFLTTPALSQITAGIASYPDRAPPIYNGAIQPAIILTRLCDDGFIINEADLGHAS